jgi:hypothetical protein
MIDGKEAHKTRVQQDKQWSEFAIQRAIVGIYLKKRKRVKVHPDSQAELRAVARLWWGHELSYLVFTLVRLES